MGRLHNLAFFLKPEYERPICDGRKVWEGRAVSNGNRASKVQAGDTVGFRITKPRRRGFVRRLEFRVAEVKKFASCEAMLKKIGVKNLLPDFGGDLDAACDLYQGLVGGGQYAAWRIDRRSLSVRENKCASKHWTRSLGMLEPGKEQPKLGHSQESFLERFGQAMLRAGQAQDVVLAHQDRLRFCGRSARWCAPRVQRGLWTKGLWPLWSRANRGDDKERLAMIYKWNLYYKGLPKMAKQSRATKMKYILSSFRWMLKFADGHCLVPAHKRVALAMKGAPPAKRRRR